LAVSREIKGLSVSRPGNGFSPILGRLGHEERHGNTASNALAIEHSANSDYRKAIVAAISRMGLGASAASHAPTRMPTAATPAPRNFGRERDSLLCDREGRAAPAEKVWRRLRAAKFGNSYWTAPRK
jgi:hypothetical protein